MNGVSSEQRAVRRIGVWIGALAFVFPVVAFIAGAPGRMLASIAIGGLLAALNFVAIQRVSTRVVRGSVRTQSILMGLLVLKMSVLMVLVYVLVRTVGVDAVGFVIGLTTLVGGLLIEGVRLAIRGETDDTPMPPGGVGCGTPERLS